MPFARVVEFDGVSAARMDDMRREMEASDKPEGLPSDEMMVLHDPEAERAIAIVFFDTEEDYAKGDAVLDAMEPGDTPGTRVSVQKFEVAMRMTG